MQKRSFFIDRRPPLLCLEQPFGECLEQFAAECSISSRCLIVEIGGEAGGDLTSVLREHVMTRYLDLVGVLSSKAAASPRQDLVRYQ
jgi:predicted DNA-binding ribbon-helix-helix protein